VIPISIILTLLIVGLLVGILSSFFGIGGGLIAVPTLYSLFPEMSSQTVIGCSLAMIFFNNILNTYNYRRIGYQFNIKVIAYVALAFIVGIVISGQIAGLLSSKSLKYIFGLFMIGVLLKTLFTPAKKHSAPKVNTSNNEAKVAAKAMLEFRKDFIPRYLTIGIVGGSIAGVTGLGGGIFLVPMLSMFLSMPFKLISPYSNAIMALGTLAGVINAMFFVKAETTLHEPLIQSFQVGNVNVFIVFLIVLGSSLTSRLGVQLNEKCPEHVLRWIFIALLLFFIIKLFLLP
jgi:hypothetical protein